MTQVSAFVLPSLRSVRPPGLVRRRDPELYQITLCLRQRMALSQARNDGLTAPGDLAVYDTSHPFEAQTFAGPDPVEAVVAHVPRAALPFPAHRLDRLLGRSLPGTHGVGAILASFLAALVRHGPELPPAELARLDSVTLDLVTAYLAEQVDLPAAVPPAGRERVLLTRIHTFIEAHLGDGGLTPRAVAEGCHISVRYLHRLFEREGTTVAAWIRSRRLDRCRRDLADPACDKQPVYAIGARWGLAGASEFNRSFRAAYGRPPGQWRLAVQRRRLCTPG